MSANQNEEQPEIFICGSGCAGSLLLGYSRSVDDALYWSTAVGILDLRSVNRLRHWQTFSWS